jgi:hypothetical protein
MIDRLRVCRGHRLGTSVPVQYKYWSQYWYHTYDTWYGEESQSQSQRMPHAQPEHSTRRAVLAAKSREFENCGSTKMRCRS